MKIWLKILVFAMALVLLLTAFVGCNTNKPQNDTDTEEEDEEEDSGEEEEKISSGNDDEEKIISRWKFPEDFSLDLEESDEDGELTELFRFFPDGGASGIRELTFSVKELKRSYRISPLSGQLSLMEVEE